MEASKALTGEVGFKSDLLKNQKYIENLLPHHVRIDRFINSAAIAWVKSDRLQKCTRLSLMEAVYTAAQLGLDFIEVKGHAYIIPFGNEAKFMPGYRGLIELAKRSPDVLDIQARIVYEKELPNFRVQYGSDPRIDHIPTITGPKGEIIGAYAIGFYTNGKSIPDWMDMEQLEKVRNVSQNKAGEIWKKWPEEMYRKAPVRRLCKYLPSNPDLELAIEKDNELYDLNEIEEPERPKITAGEATEKAKENLRHEREGANGKAPDESPKEDAEILKQRDIIDKTLETLGITVEQFEAVGAREGWDSISLSAEEAHKAETDWCGRRPNLGQIKTLRQVVEKSHATENDAIGWLNDKTGMAYSYIWEFTGQQIQDAVNHFLSLKKK